MTHPGLRLALVSLAFLLVQARPVQAIAVHGTIEFPQDTLNLTGERGFSVSAFLDSLGNGTSARTFPFVPGQTIDLLAAVTTPHGLTMLDGLPYAAYSPVCLPPGFADPFHTLGCGGTFLYTQGTTVAPPLGGPQATVVAPVTFTGDIYGTFGIQGFGHETLTAASAVAVLTLKDVVFNDDPTHYWAFQSIRYDLDPVPEPATLLLFGTSAVGLTFVRWYRRTRAHAA
jgi:hypothetical protein